MRYISALSRLLSLLPVLLIATTCAPEAPSGVGGGDLSILATATIPADAGAEDIYVNPQGLEKLRSIAEQHPGGMSTSLKASYGERFSNSFDALHVASGEPFIGQGYIWNADSNAHDFVALCMIDYVQVPCTPESPVVQLRQLSGGEEVFWHVEIPELSNGLHDFAILVVKEPYKNIKAQDVETLQTRSRTSNLSPNYVLFVGESGQQPHVESVFPTPKPDSFLKGHQSMFYISQSAELVEENGGIFIWLTARAKPGEMIDFYIHFTGRIPPFPDGRPVVAMAFIDYEQVPIYVDGEAHLPLYVRRMKETWQPVAVQVRAPDQPGVYEFVVVAHDYAYPLLRKTCNTTGCEDYTYTNDTETRMSQLIRLEVTQQ